MECIRITYIIIFQRLPEDFKNKIILATCRARHPFFTIMHNAMVQKASPGSIIRRGTAAKLADTCVIVLVLRRVTQEIRIFYEVIKFLL